MSSENQSSGNTKYGDDNRRRKYSKSSRSKSKKSSKKLSLSPPLNEENQYDSKLKLSGAKLASTNSLANLLSTIQEDVVTREEYRINMPDSKLEVQSNRSSENAETVYVQTISGYRQIVNKMDTSDIPPVDEKNKNHLVGCIERAWISISYICHGLLGGASVTHLMLILTTNPGDWPLELLNKYATFAEGFGNTFYFMAVICMVSVLDRMNLANFQWKHHRSIIWLVILLIYSATILLSLSCDSLDSRLYLTGFNVTMDEDEIKIRKLVNIWSNLSIGRSIGGIIGWIFVGVFSERYN